MSQNPEAASSDRDETGGDRYSEDPHPVPTRKDRSDANGADIFAYLVPMFAYVGLSALENYLPKIGGEPSPSFYPLAYAAKLAVVIALAWWYRSTWRDFRPAPAPRVLVLAGAIGLLVWGLWVGLDGHYRTFGWLGTRVGFNATALAPGARWVFIVVRMVGLVLVVPLIEELFWRSFLMRWLIDQDFTKVPIGRVTPLAAVTTSAFFALVHPEWLPAFLTGLLWAWLLWQTKSLGACFVSHSIANLALGIYVICTGDWKYW